MKRIHADRRRGGRGGLATVAAPARARYSDRPTALIGVKLAGSEDFGDFIDKTDLSSRKVMKVKTVDLVRD